MTLTRVVKIGHPRPDVNGRVKRHELQKIFVIVPELKAVGVLDFRELILPPYRVCFRIHRKEVVLLGVLDGRRDLGELLLRRVMLPWQRGR